MSTLLLDTHAYVWALTAPQRLGERSRSEILDSSNTLLVSAASVWEMSIKHHSGKWPEVERLLDDHESLRTRLGADDLAIASAHAHRAGRLRWQHDDPIDRMLAAQAMSIDAILVTRDAAFAEVPGVHVLW